jgi:3-oxoacyl-[acyl-carrier-protein] synthase-3
VTLFLHGLGHFHPDTEISNAFLEELDIGTTDEWILTRVGIRSRRTVLPLDYIRETRNRDIGAALEASQHTNADLGRRAATLAIDRAGLELEQIGMLLGGSSAPDTTSPAEACNVANALGLEVPALDVMSACTSFFAPLHLLSMMRPEALPDYVLVVVPEGMTRIVDYADRASAVLFGDAGVAAVVSARIPGRARILGSALQSSPAGSDKVVVPRGGHFRQEGRAVQSFAIRQTARAYEALRESYAETERRLHFVGHQVNLRMLENVCRRCAIPPERHHSNVEWYGNTAGASAASVVSMAWDKWEARDDVAMAAVGSGLTWSSFLLRFEETP